eukprot:4896460-Prymnesium_polylepis.1
MERRRDGETERRRDGGRDGETERRREGERVWESLCEAVSLARTGERMPQPDSPVLTWSAPRGRRRLPRPPPTRAVPLLAVT